ncbi:hypothetical protein CCACVL1_17968 [Corchorus capsularis]|uniref:Transmembrane protein n=1 Tax=Corchorus capsularis TaxID=210143 RepID=A0A1R3HNW6_COCAP|nr:hypothetical protein CCACVL1_17968 [Corchorus capsularis]
MSACYFLKLFITQIEQDDIETILLLVIKTPSITSPMDCSIEALATMSMNTISYSLVFFLILGLIIPNSSAMVKQSKAVPSYSSDDVFSRRFPNYKFHVVSARVNRRQTPPPPPPKGGVVRYQSPPPPRSPPPPPPCA